MLGTLLDNSPFEVEYDAPDTDALSQAISLASLHWAASIDNEGVPWTTELLPRAETNDESVDLSCALVVIDEWSRWLPGLPITFTQRSSTPGQLTIHGSDPSGALTASLFVSLPSRATRLNLRIETKARSLLPEALLQPLEIFERTESKRRLGVWLLDEGRWLVEPQLIDEDQPKLPASFLFQVRALARIQRLTGQTFPMPEQLSLVDVRNIARANALLSRNKVHGRWREVTVKADEDALKVIVQNTGDFGAQFEFVSEELVTVGEHIIPLGPAKYTLFQALLRPNKPPVLLPEAHFAVTLVSGENSRFEVELINSADDTRSRLSDAPGNDLLKTYAGRWIAQDGPAVILDGDSPDNVIAQLRKRGQLATVWRVPRSQMEAEAVDLFNA